MKVWKTAAVEKTQAAALAATVGIPVPLATVLLARGFADAQAIERFLAPRLSDLSDPFLFPDMRKAVARVWRAIDAAETIAVYGDYDVDGVCAAALMIKTLRRLGATAVPFLPRRLEEGYGFSAKALRRCLAECRPKLIVTVDCGMNSVAEVKTAAEQGVDVVVTDHHEATEKLPDAVAVLSPAAAGNAAASTLSGVGVAFKLCHALLKQARDERRAGAGEIDLRKQLGLVALGTVADVVPLLGENRILTRHGLTCLNAAESPGLRALSEVSGIKGKIDSYHIGFALGPRLNAAGRLASADQALELLLTERAERAMELARSLDAANRERKRVEEIIVSEAIEEIEGYFKAGNDFGLAAGREGWHPGAVGIAASRISARYFRPAAVAAFAPDGRGRGSCRSLNGVDIVGVLGKCGDLLSAFGGHKMAAGFEIEARNFAPFKARFNEACAEALRGSDLRPVQRVDAWIGLGEADERLLAAIERVRPFGERNPAPIWAVANARIVGPPRVLKEKHLKMTIASGGSQMEAIAFGMADREIPDGPVDIAFRLERNTFMDRSRLQLSLKDFRPSQPRKEQE